jgi:DnaK suppressor protein
VTVTKLDRRTIGELERFLWDELARLQGSLRVALEEHRSGEITRLTDLSAHASETLHAEVQVALVGRRTHQLAQIRDALSRLDEGRYGFCQECDAFIGVPRLRALPFAQRCWSCQVGVERRSQHDALLAARTLPLEIPQEAA